MSLLLELRDDAFPDSAALTQVRHAARAVIFDREGLVALLFVSRHAYHKLPGGGMEGAESRIDALVREIREETGCEIAVRGELGEVVEFRSAAKFDWIYNLHQTSYCFHADVVSNGAPDFTESEIADGFELRWMPLDRAIDTLRTDTPDNAEGGFIVRRDLAFLLAAREVRA
jgi:8-oxo-dGTP diphosphatase